MDYELFLKEKEFKNTLSGFDIKRNDLHPMLFDFQKDIIKWSLKKGKAAIFAMTGLGKTLMQLEWANQVHRKTGNNVLILAPLAVASQTVREAKKIDLSVHHIRQNDCTDGINITNYEQLHNIDLSKFGAVVLDESSILKSFTSKTREQIIDSFRDYPYKLACTATPAPNDHMELGNHAEFVNIMSRTEMLSMFFVHDAGETQKWRLKGHAEDKFWKWVASWAVLITKPSDLGYEDGAYNLPALNMKEIIVQGKTNENELVPTFAQTLSERRKARRDSLKERCKETFSLIVKKG